MMVCAICGVPVKFRPRMQVFVGWESSDGELIDSDVVAVAHPECYMRLSRDERAALRDEAARDVVRDEQ